MRALMRTECTGMIRVARKYARGYDLKLLKNSTVIVIANGNQIRFSECKQMFGRGCRKAGKSQSIIMMLDPKETSPIMAWKAIQIRKDVTNADAVKNL